MRILIDSRMIQKSGIGRYIQMLVRNMLDEYPHLQVILAGLPQSNQAFSACLEPALQSRISSVVYSAPVYSLAEQLQGRKLINQKVSADLVHIPHFNAPWSLPANSVVTIHDLIPFLRTTPRNHLQVVAGRLVLNNAVKKAARVIVISKATAQDLIQYLPADSWQDKIRVVSQGVSSDFKPLPREQVEAFKSRHRLQRYLLFVGNRAAHKNLVRLLHAFARLQSEFPDLQLVIAGKRLSVPDEVDKSIHRLGLKLVKEWQGCSDQDLHHLYCGAEMLVFPSLYEGFGLPPLEAMACGTPVTVAASASLPEVVGDAGLYFDPRQPEEIAHQASRLLNDSTLRESLRERGLSRAAMFTWHKTAQQTMAVYEEVIKGVRS